MPAHEGLASLKIDRSRGRSRQFIWKLVLLVFVAALIVAGVSALPKLSEQYLGTEVKVAHVSQFDSGKGELQAAGYVVADRMSVLAFKGTGRLKKLNVVEAQNVAPGEIIAEIDHHELDAIIANAEADLEESKSDVKRIEALAAQIAADALRAQAEVDSAKAPLDTMASEVLELQIKVADAKRRFDMTKRLVETDTMASTNVDDRITEMKLASAAIETHARRRIEIDKRIAVAQAHVRSAQAQALTAKSAVSVAEHHVKSMAARINVLKAQLVESKVFSPFDGVVIEKAAEVGEIVAPISIGGSMARGSIATIAERKSMQAEVDVAQAYIAKVKVGQRASVVVDAFPELALAGRVLRILPRANRGKATVQVRVEILEILKHKEILPDMDLRVKFLPDDAPPGAETVIKKRRAVPKDAVKGPDNARYVWVVKDGIATKSAVVTGETKDDLIEITNDGVKEGQTVATKGADAIKADGQKVRVAE